MSAVLTIARLTVAEAGRRRIVWILLGLTLLTVALTTWGVERLVSLAGEGAANQLEIWLGVSQVLILVAFMFSFVLAMTAAFLGAPAIASDLESGVAHVMLARPIRRADLVMGRWLGLAVIVTSGRDALSSQPTPPDPVFSRSPPSGSSPATCRRTRCSRSHSCPPRRWSC